MRVERSVPRFQVCNPFHASIVALCQSHYLPTQHDYRSIQVVGTIKPGISNHRGISGDHGHWDGGRVLRRVHFCLHNFSTPREQCCLFPEDGTLICGYSMILLPPPSVLRLLDESK